MKDPEYDLQNTGESGALLGPWGRSWGLLGVRSLTVTLSLSPSLSLTP